MVFMTIEEIAAKWGISPRQVRSYCADNRIVGATLEQGEWRQGRCARLMDTCHTGQDVFILGLRQFGHTKLAEKAEAEQKASENGRTRFGIIRTE